MNNEIDEILEEQFQPGFIIDSPERANWALKTLARDKAEADAYIDICKKSIEVYQSKIDKCQTNLDNDSNFLKTQLRFFFDSQPHHVTKTQEKLVLPDGTLICKKATPRYIRDDKVLVQWLQVNERWDDLKLSYTPRWDDVKVDTSIVGNTVVDTTTGQVIDGVTVEMQEPTFSVKFAEEE